MNTKVKARIQFKLDKDLKTFSIHTVTMNGEPVPTMVASAMISKMYDEYK